MVEPLPENDLADLVAANHILCREDVVDGFGHVSVRDPRAAGRFWMSRSVAPGLVTQDDILPYDLESNPLVPNPPRMYLERFIHGEIYHRHPQVMAVVHSHAAPIIPFGVVKNVQLRPIFHMAGFLWQSTPVFEIRDHADERSDLLIRNAHLGAALADTLGAAPVVLMRGHGATIVGSTLRQAVFRAIYAAKNAELQMQAIRLGGTINFLTDSEGESSERTNDLCIDRAWELWTRNAKREAIVN